MNGRDGLLILPALTASPGSNGSFVLTRKFLDGVLEYVKRWPWRVTVCMDQSQQPDSNLDHIEVHSHDLPFTLQWFDEEGIDGILDLIRSSRLVLATLVDQYVDLAATCAQMNVPLVYISEYTVQTRRQIIRTETSNPILRWRRERWTVQLERRYQKALRLAAGVQCNGTPTFGAYRTINRNPLLYFDTRVRADQLVSDDVLRARTGELLAGKPLRLAFSGRLIAMKGADHLPVVAAQLAQLGVPFSMDICGGGALERQMQQAIHHLGVDREVRMRGVLDFQTELMPFVARNVDLFVCCHRQGDPSCTYLETMSCGTPIVGYDNEAFEGLVEKSLVGWPSPLDQPPALARRIAQLSGQRSALAKAAFNARDFAAQHTLETTMQARIDHMLACAARQNEEVPA